MTRAVIEHRTHRGPSGARERAVRLAAREHAQAVLTSLRARLDGQDEALVMETYRAVMRAVSGAAANRAGEGRAAGILVGALVEVAPAYRADSEAAHAEAESIFGERLRVGPLFEREGA